MFTLALYKPLPGGGHGSPLTTVDISPDVTSLRWSTSLPGGFADMEVGMRRIGGAAEFTTYTRPLEIVPFAHAELWAGSFLCFEGRVMRIVRSGGAITGLSSIGYGISAASDDFYQSQDTTLKTSGFVVGEAVAQRAPLLRWGRFAYDPGILHARGEYDCYTPADILNAVVSEGGVDGTLWDYYVYEGREITLIPRLPPGGPPDDPPDYLIPFDDRVSWSEDYTQLYGSISVRYQNLLGSATNVTPRIPAPEFAPTYGLMRSSVVDGGKMRPGQAEVFANNFLGVKNVPAYSVQITRRSLRGLEVPGGVDAPPWTCRAGQWVGVGDMPYVPIIHTEYDATQRQLVAEAGSPLPHGSNLIRGLTRLGNHVIRGTSPITGARTN